MRILYGVQGTGNGHTTRARAMARAFAKTDVQVDYLFSGRRRKDHFDMEVFGDWLCRRGLTFAWENGRLSPLRTVLGNNLPRLIKDIRSLDLAPYDLVITDFEPITAWAARRKKVPCVGISHQYAFQYGVPKSGDNLSSRLIMKKFAPAETALGVHWHHYNSPILPPLIEPLSYPLSSVKGKVLVYLPFESTKRVVTFLSEVSDVEFFVYCKTSESSDDKNIHLRRFDRDGFQRDLASCEGVIANAGFGLLSESIQAGKKLLVKPMQGQLEQLSNALAIEQLGYGRVMKDFNLKQLREWLAVPCAQPKSYPDTAAALVEWIVNGRRESAQDLANRLWSHYVEDNAASGPAAEYGIQPLSSSLG